MVEKIGKLNLMNYNIAFKRSWNFTVILWSHILSLWIARGRRVPSSDLAGVETRSRQVSGASVDSGYKSMPGMVGEFL